MKRRIRQALFDLGIPFNLKGFTYLEYAIDYIISVDEKSFTQVCIAVGEELFIQYESIYNSILSTIKRVNRDSDAWKRYVNMDTKSNIEIIYAIAFNIMKEIEDEQDISARDSGRLEI